RLGINGVLRPRDQGTKGRTQFHVLVMGRNDILAFVDRIGAVGEYKTSALEVCRHWVATRPANTNRDIIPREFWRRYAVPAMQRHGVTLRRMQGDLGTA